MALTSQQTKRLELPHEEGAWIEVRMPSIGIMQRVRQWTDENGGAGSGFAQIGAAIMLAHECIKAWSYDAEITLENVSDLDTETLRFLETELVVAPKNSDGRST